MKLSTVKKNVTRTRGPVTVRIAAYTRQSVDRSDMEFSSIDAQRSAIEAYVASQAQEGWAVIPEHFDDQGFSGGNIERPAFKRLMQEVDAGRVDGICVYKIDRLSRSLVDFASTLKILGDQGVRFVSITQQLDTSTSTGQLMANLLATFAEFERRQIGERIKDKLIETRRRGGWQAGTAPFGYRAVKGALQVQPAEAEIVKQIFELYLALNALSDVVRELSHRGVRLRSGRPWNKTDVHRALRCRILAGFVPCEGAYFEGVQERVIDRDLFELVQTKLSTQSARGGSHVRNKYGLLLRGLIHCAPCGSAMVHTYSMSATRKWHYYVCPSKHGAAENACPDSRVAANDIESFVAKQIQAIGTDPRVITKAIAAVAEQAQARVPELEAERRRLADEIRRRGGERDRLLDAMANGGPAARALGERLGTLDQELGEAERRLHQVRGELVQIDLEQVGEDDVRTALGEFHGIWGQLVSKEQTRVLRLLIERVDFDGELGEIEIRFRAGGIKTLAQNAVRAADLAVEGAAQ